MRDDFATFSGFNSNSIQQTGLKPHSPIVLYVYVMVLDVAPRITAYIFCTFILTFFFYNKMHFFNPISGMYPANNMSIILHGISII